MGTRAEIPPTLGRLAELAMNLWWSWHPEAQGSSDDSNGLRTDPAITTRVALLDQLAPESLATLASDARFLRDYRDVVARFDDDLARSRTWFAGRFGAGVTGPVA